MSQNLYTLCSRSNVPTKFFCETTIGLLYFLFRNYSKKYLFDRKSEDKIEEKNLRKKAKNGTISTFSNIFSELTVIICLYHVSENSQPQKMAARQIINASKRTFFAGWKKPFPTQDVQSINITKIQRDNLDNPQGPFCDPFEGSIHKSDFVPTKGTGTKVDPFIIPARNEFRMMWENVDMYGDFRPFKCWWLYREFLWYIVFEDF